jgi:hypothetical protein
MIIWKPISTAPTEAPKSFRERYLIGSFPKGAMAVGHMYRLDRNAFTTMDGVFHEPTHWAELNPPDEDATDWVAEAKSMEQAFMVTKDEYSDLARAIGIEGDSFFGDPLETHQEVVARAKSIMAALKDAELALQPFSKVSETHPEAQADKNVLLFEDSRCKVTFGDMHAALEALQVIRGIAGAA